MYLHIGGGVAQDLKSRESRSRVGTTSNRNKKACRSCDRPFLMLNDEC